METTIYKRIKGSQMEKIYENDYENMSIKYYDAIDCENSDYVNSNTYKFKIIIRHSEGTSAVKLFNEVLKKAFPVKQDKKSLKSAIKKAITENSNYIGVKVWGTQNQETMKDGEFVWFIEVTVRKKKKTKSINN